MAWPPQSPDLISIKPLWNNLDQRVGTHSSTSTADLWEVLQMAREEITLEYQQKLINRAPQICQAVIAAKGSNQ